MGMSIFLHSSDFTNDKFANRAADFPGLEGMLGRQSCIILFVAHLTSVCGSLTLPLQGVAEGVGDEDGSLADGKEPLSRSL